MRKTILILAATVAAAVPTIGAIAAEGEQRFVHEGSTYVYTRSDANGQSVIRAIAIRVASRSASS